MSVPAMARCLAPRYETSGLCAGSVTAPASRTGGRYLRLVARPLRISIPGGLVHVTMRGADRRDIFVDELDRLLFLRLLDRNARWYSWVCLAYCVMGNHFHLVLRTPEPNLSDGMRDLAGIYARRFNSRRGRQGHLYEGRFEDEPITTEAHLLETLRYVVLNPVRAGFRLHPAEWEWSSYGATIGECEAPAFLDVQETLQLFGRGPAARKAYERFVADRLPASLAEAAARRALAA